MKAEKREWLSDEVVLDTVPIYGGGDNEGRGPDHLEYRVRQRGLTILQTPDKKAAQAVAKGLCAAS